MKGFQIDIIVNRWVGVPSLLPPPKTEKESVFNAMVVAPDLESAVQQVTEHLAFLVTANQIDASDAQLAVAKSERLGIFTKEDLEARKAKTNTYMEKQEAEKRLAELERLRKRLAEDAEDPFDQPEPEEVDEEEVKP